MSSLAAGRIPQGDRAAAFAPAGVALALLVVVVQIRMDDPWADGVLFVVAALGAVPLVALGLAAARGDGGTRAEMTVLLVAGLVLGGVALARLGDLLGGDDFTATGGTLTLVLALFTALAGFCFRRTRAAVCALLTALAAVALTLEFVNWAFGAEDIDVFRVLLALLFAALFAAGAMVGGRVGTLLIAAAGVSALAGYYTTGVAFLFSVGDGGLGWGWELIALAEGLALAAYAALRLEPGPAYLAFFVLLVFVTTAALSGTGDEGGIVLDGEEPTPADGASLVGWPLVLALATIGAVLWGLRRSAAQIAARS